MDDVGKKEPHEHSRTTTFLREGDLRLSRVDRRTPGGLGQCTMGVRGLDKALQFTGFPVP